MEGAEFDDDMAEEDPGESPWVTYVLKPFPAPVFAFAVGSAALFGCLTFCIMAAVHGSALLWAIGGTLGSIAALIAAASCLRRFYGHHRRSVIHPRYAGSQRHSTTAIVVLLVAIYSSLLTVGLHLFDLFAGKGADEFKYYLTLAIALCSSVYTSLHGRHVIREHFGPEGGRDVFVTPGQAAVVVLVVISFSVYLVWLCV